ncbi:MAG: lamin tail domain-containing protein [Kiritimatiellae bacterium]|nr:lamin tail domain-containing protein [Kiritimatiellia bacterium]
MKRSIFVCRHTVWLVACAVLLATSVSSAETLVLRAASWRYHKGTTEASDPRDEWQSADFIDTSWALGNAPLGYGETGINTTFSDMQGSYTTFFVRRTFTVSSVDADMRLKASVDYDDGFIVWINGERVLDVNEPDGTPLYDSLSSGNHESGTFEDYELPDPSDYLEVGANVMAIQVFNQALDSTDIKIDIQLDSYTKVADTTFSHDRGFYSSPFTCTISTATPGATIKYTLDGSDPRTSGSAFSINASSGTVSINPASSTGRLINGGKAPCVVLRAYALKGGCDPTDVDTHTYIFLSEVLKQPNLMSGEDWVPGEPDGYSTSQLTSYPVARRIDTSMEAGLAANPTTSNQLVTAFRAIPTISISLDYGDLFGNSHGVWHNSLHYGPDWERPCSAEFIFPDDPGENFHIACGVRAAGAGSRDPCWKTKCNLSLRFRSTYGPSKLRYPFFPDTSVDEFDQLRLRAQGNDKIGDRAQYIRDAWGRATQRAMGWVSPCDRWAHVYINGMYWGLYNPAECPDSGFMESHFGGEKEDYDVIANKKWYRCIPTPPNYERIIDGDDVAWDAMVNYAKNNNLATDAYYQTMRDWLNITEYIDYTLLGMYGAGGDWSPPSRADPGANFRAGRRSRNRAPYDTQYHFFTWDYEVTMDMYADNNVYSNITWHYGIGRLHEGMEVNIDYQTEFGDRLYRHIVAPDGALTPAAGAARYSALADTVEPLLICEYARWADARNEDPAPSTQTALSQWRGWRDSLLNNWFPLRSSVLLSQFRNASPRLWPVLVAPSFHQHGGAIASGFKLTVSNPNTACTIYYTLDGSDPRRSRGSRSPDALLYSGPAGLSRTTHVKARVWKSNTTWSPVHEATYNYTAHYGNIRITEILYNPLGGGDFEFIEIKNTGSSTRGLSGMTFRGIDYTFPPGAELEGNQMALLVQNESVFTNRYPAARDRVAIWGVYRGRLDNSGERIALLDCEGRTVTSVRYNDKAPWPEEADGDGYSLVPTDTSGDQDDAAKWRASNLIGGSPGYDDGTPYRVVINEALTHTDLPQVDTIELFNDGSASVDIGGWYLSDAVADYQKFRIPAGTTIAAGGYVLFDEHDFNTDTNNPACFALSSHGDELYLTKWDGAGNLEYLAEARFGGAENGVAFARYVTTDGDADFVAQSTPTTFGGANAYPAVGPVVINELLYHPAAAAGYEFIELYNLSDSSVPLYDTANPANRWKLSAAVGFEFPAGASIGAREYALVVPTNEAAFRAQYPGVPAGVQIFGPYAGRLSNGGESVKLWRPDAPDPEGVPWILVDRVKYADDSLWPENADGDGPSLERQDPAAYGNDSANWASSLAAGGTPGALNSGVLVPKTAGWLYHDRGEDLGTAWRGAAYDDGGWDDGNGPLGYGYTNLDTEVSYGDDPDNKSITTYFRKIFTLAADPDNVSSLSLCVDYDDGFVAYLNGQEVARGSMPGGTIDYVTPATSHAAGSYETFDLTAQKSALVQGLNVLAVEAHQSGIASGDLFMDLELKHSAVVGNPPAVPQNLSASAVSQTRIDLSWTDASDNETGFRIDRRQSGLTAWVEAGTRGANQTTFSDLNLAAGTPYYYKVKAYNDDGNSPYSNVATATTQQGPPGAPSGLSATAASGSAIELRWTDGSGNETGFKIERSPNGSSSWQQIATAGADVTAYSDAGLPPATAFTYRVRATNAIGDSDYSNVAGATTLTIYVRFAAAGSSGNENVSPATLSVTLSGPSTLAVSVNYAAAGGTAAGGGVDYTLASGTLIFAAGQTSKSISIAIVEDETDESDETIVVALSSPANAALGAPAVHTYTIQDNDQLFEAYNDLCWTNTQLSANITAYTRTESGNLVDVHTGQTAPATVTLNDGGGGPYLTQGAGPSAGTDAYAVFNGKVDCAGVISYGENLTITFGNLDASLRYEFVLFANRDNSAYTDRFTTATLSGADAFENHSTAGAQYLGTADPATVICSGWNTQNGFVTRYANIDAGADNAFTVTLADNATRFYANAFMLRATRPVGQQTTVKVAKGDTWRYRKGTSEASDPVWAWTRLGFDDSGWSTGATPIGYGDGPYATTLDDMRGNYTTVYLRREFLVDQPARVSELRLDALVDDSFIIWLNGEELARTNVAGAAGTYAAYDEWGVISIEPAQPWTASFSRGDLPALRYTNVVAVHAINCDTNSSDLTLDLEVAVVEGSPMTAGDDGDQDAMADAWEVAQLGGTAEPAAGDKDGDGQSNLEEYIGGTDPDNAGQLFRLDLSVSGAALLVSFPAVQAAGLEYPGMERRYSLQNLVDLAGGGVWADVPEYANILGAGQTVTYTNTSPSAPAYYRARVWLQP